MGTARTAGDLAIGAVLIAVGALVVALSLGIDTGVQTDPLGPRAFPIALGAAIALCGLLYALSPGRLSLPTPALAESPEGDGDPAGAMPGHLGAAVALTAGYIFAFEPVGYLLATPCYVASLVLLQGDVRWRGLLVAPLLVTAAFYAAFRFGLLIPVPDGLLGPWLPW